MIDESFVRAIQDGDITPEVLQIGDLSLVGVPKGWELKDPRHMPGPAPEVLKLGTLTGLVDYLEANRDQLDLKACQLHVASGSLVSLLGPLTAEEPRRRPVYAMATYPGPSLYAAARWMSPEDCVVALQVDFEPTDERAQVLAVVGNLREEAVRQTSDDGVSQTVVARTGIARVAEVPVPCPVALRLRCTWPEVTPQPLGLYVLRLRGGSADAKPQAALFGADGHALEAAAAGAVAFWLRDRVAKLGLPVLG
jgi:hypothetical protein